ncbi:MAG: hypothetical protein RIR51_589 [Bacteroidota bacterium]|jgi:D-3-phosphoglycerate dehydrogenase
MNKGNVLIVDDVHQNMMDGLLKLGYSYDYKPEIKPEEILEIIGNFQGLVIRSKTKINNTFLDKASNLKFIARAGAGLDLIDEKEAESKGIQIFAANAGNAVAVAEHVLGLLLAISSKIKKAHIEATNGIFDRESNRGWELAGKTIGVIGYGHNGSALVKRLKNFEMNILVYDKYKSGFEFESNMDEIFKKADIISLHIPATTETIGMVNDSFIQKFQKPFVFLNVSRGNISPLKPLNDGLEKGKIIGAGMDVLPNEKVSTWNEEETKEYVRLMNHPNVIITPHVAGWSVESYEKIPLVLLEQIKNIK